MSRYSLVYAYTCPDLDKEIADAKSVLEDHVEDILVELTPLMGNLRNTPECKEWIQETSNSLYESLESIFENCRSINEDIRSAADSQIAECVRELEDSEEQVKVLEEELDNVMER